MRNKLARTYQGATSRSSRQCNRPGPARLAYTGKEHYED
jgi:hypothetical protein